MAAGYIYSQQRLKVNNEEIVKGVVQESVNKYESVALDVVIESAVKANISGALPSGSATMSSFSPDGSYLAVAHVGAPFLSIYAKSGTGFYNVSKLDVLPPDTCYSVAFSPSGEYLAVGLGKSPYIMMYKNNNGRFIKIQNLDGLPSDTVRAISFSPNGKYVIFGHGRYLSRYKIDGDVITKLNAISVSSHGEVLDLAFSPDSKNLAIMHEYGPYISINSCYESGMSKVGNFDILPEHQYRGLTYSPDGKVLVAVSAESSSMDVYDVKGSYLYKKYETVSGRGYMYDVCFSPNGKFLVFADHDLTFVTYDGYQFRKMNTDSFPKINNAYKLAISPDSQFVAIVSTGPPYITVLKLNYKSKIRKASKIGELIKGDSAGITIESGEVGDTIKISKIFSK